MATYNKETFKRLFQSKFNLSKWQMLLQDYFHADKVRVSPEVLTRMPKTARDISWAA